MRLLGRILSITFALLLALLIGGAYWIQDANRLKPELETLIAEYSKYAVNIDGDITWELFPPLKLKIQNLNLRREGEEISAAMLELKMDLSAMWEDINKWQLNELKLHDTVLTQDGTITTLKHLALYDFQPNEPAKFEVDAAFAPNPEDPPVTAKMQGMLGYHPETETEPESITLSDTRIDTELATGICQAAISRARNPLAQLPPATDEGLLPIAAMLTYNIGAECALNKLNLGTQTFQDSSIEITNAEGFMSVLLNIKDFLGGTLLADIDIEATQQPIQWNVLPEIDNVDSQRLLDWTQRNMQWIAPIAFNSSINMSGNRPVELANSLQARSTFDGGQGQINIARIKQQLMQIAILAGQTDEVADWPDLWNYEQFSGQWNITGPAHNLSFALDNMSVTADGNYDYQADTIDMLAQITINEAPPTSPLQINPLLQGTPIPVHCKGPAADPQCSLDEGAAKSLLARALQRDDASGLREKLEDKIDQKVPEEYRETARSILDLLGRSLEEG